MKTKITVIFLMTFSSFFLSQIFCQTNVLYFMENVPTCTDLNPGFVPTQKAYVSILSSVYADLMTNSFAPSDFLKSVNGEMKTAFDTGGDSQSFLNALKPENYINLDSKINLLGFGFKAKKNYFSLGLSEHIASSLSLPYELPNLLIKGLPTSGTANLDLKSLGLDISMFSEVSLGYSREILPNLTAGAKVKYLIGQMYSNITFSTLNLKGNYSSSVLTGNGALEMYTPVEIPAKVDGTPNVDSLKFSSKSFTKPCGSGFAFDFGAVYKPIDNLTLSVSVTDLGSITWGNNNWTGEMKSQTHFKDVSFQLNGSDSNNSLGDSLSGAFNFSRKNVKKTSKLTSHTRVGAEYSVLNNKIGFGLLYDYRKNIYYSEGIFTGSVNFRPFYALNATLAYSQLNAKTGSLSAGLDFNFGPETIYFAGDYIPFSFSDSYVPKTNHINFQVGIISTFGRVKKQAKKTEE